METNDYEKAKQECRNECFEKFLKTTGWTKEQVTDDVNLAFNYLFEIIFKRAYQLGKEHAESDRDAEMLKTHLKVEHYLSEKRIQLAGMAMQGILANGQSNSAGFVAEKAVRFADALLNELNETCK